MSHHLRKNPLQTPPVLYLYNFIGMAMRVTTVMDSLLQAGHPQDELAGEIQEPPSTLMCHAGPDWLQSQGALAMGSHWPWDVPGGLVTQLSTAGVHTHAKGRGDDLQEPSLRERLAPTPHPHSERRTGMEVMAPPPARGKGVTANHAQGVMGTSQRDSHDFIPPFYLFQLPALQFAKQPLAHAASPPALCHGPWGTGWKSLFGQLPPSPPLHSPPSHPSQAPIPPSSWPRCSNSAHKAAPEQTGARFPAADWLRKGTFTAPGESRSCQAQVEFLQHPSLGVEPPPLPQLNHPHRHSSQNVSGLSLIYTFKCLFTPLAK